MSAIVSIPLPRQRHWERVRAGHIIERPALPDPSTGQQEIILDHSGRKKPAVPLAMHQQGVHADAAAPLRIILSKPHQQADALDPRIAAVKKKMTAMIKQYPRMDLVYGQDLDIRVSNQTLDRAIQIMDTVLKWIKANGYRINHSQHETQVFIHEQELIIKLREKTKRIDKRENSWNRYDYEPTGKLYFKVGRWPEKEYRDGAKTLEEQLPVVFTRMEEMAKEKHERHLRHEIERARVREAAELRRQKEKLCEKELSDFKDLLQEAKRWHQTIMVRDYIASSEKMPGASTHEAELNWIAWAKGKAEWYDPLVNAPDDLLELADRNTLTMEKKSDYGY